MNARENILTRIRKAQGRTGSEPTEQELLAVRDEFRAHEIGPLPGIALPVDRVAHFKAECARLESSCTQLGAIGEVPHEVAAYLERNGLEKRAVIWHELAHLDWKDAGVAVDDRPANGEDRTGITGSFCAIAETGTLLLLSAPHTPKATAVLPDTHICIARLARLVDTMEEAFAMMRNEVGEPPRATFFVSGPSRTADIEQTIVIGAPGPYRVHVILVA